MINVLQMIKRIRVHIHAKNREVDMLSGSIYKGLLAISIPIMIMNVLQSLFGIVDMAILRVFDDGGTAVGAVGVCGSLITLITVLVIGVSTGANVVIARHIGRRDRESVNRSVYSALGFSVVAGIGLTAIGVTFAKVFLIWANCPVELLEEAAIYFRLYFVGVPILMVYNFCAAILRATGDSQHPMVYFSIGGVVKIVLTIVFTGVFHLGVVGVAVATIISWIISAALSMLALVRGVGMICVRLRSIRIYWPELADMMQIGVPAGLQQALYSVANVVISATVNSFGPAATTGISIANHFDGVLYQISCAASLAVLPYVSQNVGCGNIRRATESVKKGILLTTAMGASMGALSAIFSAQLSSIMSGDPAVIAYSQQKMVIISSTYFICGINEIFGAALRGMKRPNAAAVAALFFTCILRFIWVYLIFPLIPNLTFLYLVWPVGWILSIIALICVYIPTVKKLTREADAAAQS